MFNLFKKKKQKLMRNQIHDTMQMISLVTHTENFMDDNYAALEKELTALYLKALESNIKLNSAKFPKDDDQAELLKDLDNRLQVLKAEFEQLAFHPAMKLDEGAIEASFKRVRNVLFSFYGSIAAKT